VFGYRVSRLGLGTVQLGLTYGVANKTGQPKQNEALLILDEAKKLGITLLDTARGYGTSEDVIGVFLNGKDSSEMIVSTKLPGVSTLTLSIRETVDLSRSKLGLKKIPFLLLHRADDLNENVLIQLMELKEAGYFDRLGVSIYTPKEAELALGHKEVDIIQVPFNVFDQRLKQNGFFTRAGDLGKTVIARSAYLQGLALMSEEVIPVALSAFIPFKRKLKGMCEDAKINEKEFALRYVLSQNEITSVIVGAESLKQVRENATTAERGPLPQDICHLIEEAFVQVPVDIINPALWQLKK